MNVHIVTASVYEVHKENWDFCIYGRLSYHCKNNEATNFLTYMLFLIQTLYQFPLPLVGNIFEKKKL